MTIDKKQENGKTIFTLNGRLDTTTAPQLQEVLIPAFEGVKEVILEISQLIYVSSAGLRVFLMGQKEAKKKGGSMTIRGTSEEVMEVFEMTGFADILHIES